MPPDAPQPLRELRVVDFSLTTETLHAHFLLQILRADVPDTATQRHRLICAPYSAEKKSFLPDFYSRVIVLSRQRALEFRTSRPYPHFYRSQVWTCAPSELHSYTSLTPAT